MKIHPKLNKFRIKRLDGYIVSDLRFLLKIQAILPETSPFLFAQMAVLSSSFQMFIVLGMYNFAAKLSLKRWQDIYFTVVNCLFYRSTWFPQSFINQRLLTIGLLHQLELGLSKKHTKFEKIFFMVWTFELVNVQTTMREIFLNFVWFSESPNFMGPKMNTQK